MESGTVRWLDDLERRGFLAPDDGGRDLGLEFPGQNARSEYEAREGGEGG